MELPTFEYPVLFHEPEHEYQSHFQEPVLPAAEAIRGSSREPPADPEIFAKGSAQNPIDTKFLTLAHTITDANIKPNTTEKKEIDVCNICLVLICRKFCIIQLLSSSVLWTRTSCGSLDFICPPTREYVPFSLH